MFRNYLKTAIRNLTRNKGFAVINIAGLSMGIIGCLVMVLFITDEKKFDHFRDADSIFRVYNKRAVGQAQTSMPMVPPTFAVFAQQQFPEVDNTLRILNIPNKELLENGNVKAYEEKGLMADNSFFSFFPIEFKAGNPATALKEKNNIVITAATAKKYFGDKNAIGKTLMVGKDPFMVTGIVKKIPEHFHLDFNYIVSLSSLNVPKERMEHWTWQQFFTYIKLKPGTDAMKFQAKFQQGVKEKSQASTRAAGFSYTPFLQPLKDVHLKSVNFEWDIAKRGNITYVNALIIIAIFVLAIACFNFINLATARSYRRAKEIGVRKVIGAERGQLIIQFTGETVMLAIVAVFIAGLVVMAIMPWFNSFTGKSIRFNFFTDPVLALMLLTGAFVTGILAGVYPAMVLAGFQPVKVLKGLKVNIAGGQALLRRSLVVIQFTLSVLLIICTLIVYRQVSYLHTRDLGFSKDQLVTLRLPAELISKIGSFKAELLHSTNISSATAGYGLPGDIFAGDEVIIPMNGDKTYPVSLFVTDEDYVKTLGLEMAAGRDFSKEMSTDKDKAFLINETAVTTFGFGTAANALGQQIHWQKWDKDSIEPIKKGTVVGVVKDFHYKSLHEKMSPMVLQLYPEYYKMAVKLKGSNIKEALSEIKATWSKYVDDPLDYSFMDESFGSMYKAEDKLEVLLWIFTVMAIFIGCMGLFGLAAFGAQQRVKEIGIRKVLGATVFNIVSILSQNFIALILLSSILALPIGWWVMNSWLKDFPYRVEMNWWIFVLAAVAAMGIGLITVGFQAIKAALANPVKSLRSD